MAWQQIQNTNWTTAPDTSDPGANGVLYDGWQKKTAFTSTDWTISSGLLVNSCPDFTVGYLLGSDATQVQDHRGVIYFPAGSLSGVVTHRQGVAVRMSASNNYYVAWVDKDSTFQVYSNEGGAFAQLHSQAVTLDPSHVYYVDFSAKNVGPTDLVAILHDVTAGADVDTYTGTDNSTGLQISTGYVVHYHFSQGATQVFNATRSQSYVDNPGLIVSDPTFGSSTRTANVIDWDGASGGTAPLTAALYRDARANFTTGVGNKLADVNPDGSDFPYTDSSPSTSDPFNVYTIVVTDATPQSVRTVDLVMQTRTAPFCVGFIGDSITADTVHSGTTAPTIYFAQAMQHAYGLNTVTVVNQGQPGSTTGSWLPTDPGNGLVNAVTAFNAASPKVSKICIMLGTNDARDIDNNRIPSSTLVSNLNTIISYLFAHVTDLDLVVLNCPPYSAPGALFGSPPAQWSELSVGLLQDYRTAIIAMDNGTTVRVGDTTLFGYMAEQVITDITEDGVHPTSAFNVIIGRDFWAQSFTTILNGTGGGGGSNNSRAFTKWPVRFSL